MWRLLWSLLCLKVDLTFKSTRYRHAIRLVLASFRSKFLSPAAHPGGMSPEVHLSYLIRQPIPAAATSQQFSVKTLHLLMHVHTHTCATMHWQHWASSPTPIRQYSQGLSSWRHHLYRRYPVPVGVVCIRHATVDRLVREERPSISASHSALYRSQ